jgi:hypothetical protein
MHMRVSRVASFCLVVLAMAGTAAAQSSTGTLTVTANIQASIELTFESDLTGVALGTPGTGAASLAFGNISAFGTLPPAVGRVVGASTYTVSSPFAVRVKKANADASGSYRLRASLNDTNIYTVAVGGVTLNNSLVEVVASQTYETAHSYPLQLTVPFSADTGLITRVVTFTATAN